MINSESVNGSQSIVLELEHIESLQMSLVLSWMGFRFC